jgi:hypothetical protein
MQTFLPFKNFSKSANCLDRMRLGKQRVETLQIMKSITTDNVNGWRNHPAVLMWKEYPWALLQYQISICNEWTGRGYKDTCLDKSINLYKLYMSVYEIDTSKEQYPNWIGNENFHISHQSNLLRKNKNHYIKFFDVDPTLPYYWPTKEK